MAIDWDEFEAALADLTRLSIERLTQEHPDQVAYEFMVHCSADYGDVFHYLRVRPQMEKQGENRFPEYPDHLPRNPDGLAYYLTGWKELELWDDDLEDPRVQRWIACDFPTEPKEYEGDFRELLREFLRRACRVSVQLELDGALESIPKEPCFVLFVEDHDEVDYDSWRRLIEARVELVPPWASEPWAISGRHPEMATAIFVLATKYRERGQLLESAHLLREAVARLPELQGPEAYPVPGTNVTLPIPENNAWARAYLALTVEHMFDQQQNPIVIEKAFQFDSEFAEAYFLRAKQKWGPIPAQEIELAVADLDRAIQLDDSKAKYFGTRAELRARPYYPFREQAIANYTSAHQLDPFNQKWLMRRAELFVEEQQYENAIADFTKVFELWHSEVSWYIRRALIGRANCWQELGQFAEAQEDWNLLIAYEKVRDYHTGRAICRRALGDDAGAKEDEAIAAELEKDD